MRSGSTVVGCPLRNLLGVNLAGRFAGGVVVCFVRRPPSGSPVSRATGTGALAARRWVLIAIADFSGAGRSMALYPLHASGPVSSQ